MKILGGVVAPSDGHDPHRRRRARAALTVAGAIAAGIAFVHQELNLFDNLDVAANVFIGREPRFGGPLRLIDRGELRAPRRAAPATASASTSSRDTPVADLSLAQRQLVEIAKALSLDARLVIMDEPTSSLTALGDRRACSRSSPSSRPSGVSVIFISHRLNEVEHCADRVVVLRDGAVVGELDRRRDPRTTDDPADDRPRPQGALHPAGARRPASRVLEVAGVRTAALSRRRRSTSRCARGEILGLAGLVGAGRTELARAIFGIDRVAWRRDPRSTASRSRSARRATPSTAASTWCPRTASASGLLLEHVDRRQHLAAEPAGLRLGPADPPRRRAAQRRRTSARRSTSGTGVDRHAASAPCRAATSRRSCSPNGCR